MEELDFLLYPVEGLELRQRGRRLSGRFPYGRTATMKATGKVRKEMIVSGAFNFALRDLTREIQVLSGHNFDRPLGSRIRGSAEFIDSVEALEFEVRLPELSQRPSWIRDAVLAVEGGLVAGISPGFRIPPKSINENAERFVPEVGNEGVEIREIHDSILYELSLVSRPAYTETSLEIRASMDDAMLMRLL